MFGRRQGHGNLHEVRGRLPDPREQRASLGLVRRQPQNQFRPRLFGRLLRGRLEMLDKRLAEAVAGFLFVEAPGPFPS